MNVKVEYVLNGENIRDMIITDSNFIDVALSLDSYLIKKGIISEMENIKSEPGVILKFDSGYIKIYYTTEDY